MPKIIFTVYSAVSGKAIIQTEDTSMVYEYLDEPESYGIEAEDEHGNRLDASDYL